MLSGPIQYTEGYKGVYIPVHTPYNDKLVKQEVDSYIPQGHHIYEHERNRR